MQHFRVIRDIAVKWKDAQRQDAAAATADDDATDNAQDEVETLLNQYLDELGEDGTF